VCVCMCMCVCVCLYMKYIQYLNGAIEKALTDAKVCMCMCMCVCVCVYEIYTGPERCQCEGRSRMPMCVCV